MHPFITVFALLSFAVALLKRDARFAIVSWLVLLIVLFGIRRIRYTLPVFPMVALMAGYGLQIVKQDDLRRFIAYGIVSTSLVIAFFAYLPLAERMSAVNLKHAGAYLNTLGGDGYRGHNASPEGAGYQPRGFRAAARPVHEQAHPLPIRAREPFRRARRSNAHPFALPGSTGIPRIMRTGPRVQNARSLSSSLTHPTMPCQGPSSGTATITTALGSSAPMSRSSNIPSASAFTSSINNS